MHISNALNIVDDHEAHEEYTELMDASEIFEAFIRMMEAGRSLDGDEELTNQQVLLHYCGPGCGVMLTVGHFRRLAAIREKIRGKQTSPSDRASTQPTPGDSRRGPG